MSRELVVDGIVSTTITLEGQTVHRRELFSIEDDNCRGDRCGICSPDRDFWEWKRGLWQNQLKSFDTEWNPDIVF